MRVLLVEDDHRVAEALQPALARHGMAVRWVPDGRTALSSHGEADVVLLDLILPDIDGVEVCRRIRAVSDVPIIVVSAQGEVEDRIRGLRTGADDYLVKPYDIGELVARVHAVCRRKHAADAPLHEPIALGDVTVDLDRHEVLVAGTPVTLSRKEFQVLAMLATARGAVCSRERIIAEVWGQSWPGVSRTLDVHIATLRTKLGRPGLVQTVRGVGYRVAQD